MGKVNDVEIELFRTVKEVMEAIAHLDRAIIHQQEIINVRKKENNSNTSNEIEEDYTTEEYAPQETLEELEEKLKDVSLLRQRLALFLSEMNPFLK